jgi:hypothetical protein
VQHCERQDITQTDGGIGQIIDGQQQLAARAEDAMQLPQADGHLTQGPEVIQR